MAAVFELGPLGWEFLGVVVVAGEVGAVAAVGLPSPGMAAAAAAVVHHCPCGQYLGPGCL